MAMESTTAEEEKLRSEKDIIAPGKRKAESQIRIGEENEEPSMSKQQIREVSFHQDETTEGTIRKDREKTMEASGTSEELRILIIGKTGNGKSSLGNTLTGEKSFPVGRGMMTKTREAKDVLANVQGKQFKVVDTPDIDSLNDEESKKKEVSTWKSLVGPSPDAILLAVKCDVRYTAEEYAVYQEIKKLWGNDTEFCQRLIVAFTYGDLQDEDLDEEVRTVCKELKSVLRDAGNRYILFNNRADSPTKKDAVKSFLKQLETIATCSGRRYSKSILIIGKTGNGKSSLGNIITGRDEFRTGRGVMSTTLEAKPVLATVQGKKIQVVDTPDISEMEKDAKLKEISHWKELTAPGPDAILLTVGGDGQYTAKEYAIYKEIKDLWGEDSEFCQRLTVAFISRNPQKNPDEVLKTVSGPLKNVMVDAGQLYLQFSTQPTQDENEKAVKHLLFYMKVQKSKKPVPQFQRKTTEVHQFWTHAPVTSDTTPEPVKGGTQVVTRAEDVTSTCPVSSQLM